MGIRGAQGNKGTPAGTAGNLPSKEPEHRNSPQRVIPVTPSVPQSGTMAKDPALHSMPPLNKRQLSSEERGMTNLQLAVEAPNIVISPPQASGANGETEQTQLTSTEPPDSIYQPENSLFSRTISKVAEKLITRYSDAFRDTKELEVAKTQKKIAKKACEKALNVCKETTKNIEKLSGNIEKLSLDIKKRTHDTDDREKTHHNITFFPKRRQQKRIRKQAELEKIEAALKNAEKELTDKKTVLKTQKDEEERCQDTLKKARNNIESLTTNGNTFIKSVTSFLTSVRRFYAACHSKENNPVAVNMPIYLDHTVINTDNGPVTLNDVSLSLSGIAFVEGPGGKMSPIFKINQLTATVDVPMPDGQIIKTSVKASGIKAGVAAGIGPVLHEYITASNGASAAMGFLKKIKHAKDSPSYLSLNVESLDLELPDLSSAKVAGIVKNMKSTPGSTINALFRDLDYRLSLKAGQIRVKTSGELLANGQFSNVNVDYRPRIPQQEGIRPVKGGCTPRKLSVQCQKVEGGLSNGVSEVSAITEMLSPSSPLSQWLETVQPEHSALVYTETPALKPEQKTGEDLTPLSIRTDFSVSRLKLEVIRDIEAAGTDKARVTGNNQATATADEVKLINQGSLDTEVVLKSIQSELRTTDGQPDSHGQRSELDMTATIASSEADFCATNAVAQKIMGKNVDFRGKAKISTGGTTKVTCKQSGNEFTVQSQLPALKTEITEPVLLSKEGSGVYLSAGQVSLCGDVSITSNDTVRTIKPNLTASSNNEICGIIDGQRIPLNLSASVTVEKTTPKLFVHKDPDTNLEKFTAVLPSSSIDFNTIEAGPLTMGQVKIVRNGSDFGAIHIIDAEINFDTLIKTLPDDDPQKKLIKLSWIERKLLKHKKLTFNAELRLEDGQVDLNQCQTFQPKVVPLPSASIIDRLVCWALNKVVKRKMRKLHHFSLSIETPTIEDKTSSVKKIPVLNIKKMGIYQLPLPFSVECVDTAKKSICLPFLVYQKTGALMVSTKHVREVEHALKQINRGDSTAVTSLLNMVKDFNEKKSHIGLIHLIARQFPIQTIDKLFAENPTLKDTLSAGLIECADSLLNKHPLLCNEAIHIRNLAGDPMTPERTREVIDRAQNNDNMDPTGLGILMEQEHHDPDRAEQCYQLALTHHKSEPLANQRLGMLLLNRQHKNPSPEEIDRGFGHLMTSWQTGNKMVVEDLKALEQHQEVIIAQQAKLRLAIIQITEEKNHHDFESAIERLVELAQQETDHPLKEQAMNLLRQRQQNGSVIFHTSDIDVFNNSQEQLAIARKSLKRYDAKTLQPIAHDLGIKCLYGSHGVVQNNAMAYQLLLIAARGRSLSASIHLELARAALSPTEVASCNKIATTTPTA